jgi:hypothetical protein
MSKLDEWGAQLLAGLREGAGDVARGAWADIGNAYQQILAQNASVGPPTPPPGDMLVTHPPDMPGPASDAELQGLIDSQAIAEQATAADLEQETEGPAADVDAGLEPE